MQQVLGLRTEICLQGLSLAACFDKDNHILFVNSNSRPSSLCYIFIFQGQPSEEWSDIVSFYRYLYHQRKYNSVV